MISSTWNSFSFTFWANLGKIQESLANIIIIYGDSVSLHGLMLNLVKQFLTWKVWVMNSQWDATHHADYVLVDSFHGSFIFSYQHEEMAEFPNFFKTVNPFNYPEDIYLPNLWFLFYKCPFSELDCQILERCQPNASLEFLPRPIFDKEMSEESYDIYKAEMSLQQVQMQPFRNEKEMVFFPGR